MTNRIPQRMKLVFLIYLIIGFSIVGVGIIFTIDAGVKEYECKKQCLDNFDIFLDYDYSYRHNGTCTCIHTNQLTIYDDGNENS